MGEMDTVKDNISLENALEKYGRIVWTCKGRSMEPLIREAVDHVVIEKPEREIRPDDVVIYPRDASKYAPSNAAEHAPETAPPKREYVLHRVIERRDDEFIILGDNCITYEHVPEDRVIGIMTGLIRDGKSYDFDSAAHRAYMRLWVRPYGFRVALTRARFRLKRMFAKATKR